MNQETKFSLFKGFKKDQKPGKSVSMMELALGIRDSHTTKKMTEDYRNEYAIAGKTPKTDEMKKEFPHFTPVGEFSVKNNEGFIEDSWTGYVGFDIDRGDNPDIDWEILWGNICTSEHVGIAFRSPSNGIKGLIKVDLAMDKETFVQTVKTGIYPYFESAWKCKLDPKQATLSQSMFICHDPDVYAVENPIPFVPQKKVTVFSFVPDQEKDDKQLMNLLRYLQDCPKGQVFTQTQKTSILAAKMIKGGAWDIDKEKALEILWEALKQAPGVSDPRKAYNDLRAQFFGALSKSQFTPITKEDIAKDEFLKKLKKSITNSFWDEDSTYVRIGTKWYVKPDSVSEDLILWNTESIKQDHAKHEADEILTKSPKYKGFINWPEYVKYEQIVDSKWNLAKPLHWTIKEGDWSAYEEVLKHIFGARYEIILDWLQISYLHPKQSLPVICLVSKSNNTGKTTFLSMLEILFSGNTAQISIEEFNGEFNSHFAHKNFILVDETETEDNLMKQVGPKLKRWVTQKKVNWHPKGITPVVIDYFGKFVLCSNDETNFIRIQDSDTRYMIIKVPQLKKLDVDIIDKLRAQAGSFLDMLGKRKMKTEKKTRLWFSPKDYITEEFKAAAEQGKSWLYHELKELFLIDLEDRNLDFWLYSSSEIFEMMKNCKQSFNVKYLKKVMSDEFGLGNNDQKKFMGKNKRGWMVEKRMLVTESRYRETNAYDTKNEVFSLF